MKALEISILIFSVTLMCFICGCTDTPEINEMAAVNNANCPVATDSTNGQQLVTNVRFSDMQFVNGDDSNTTLKNNITSVDPTYNELVDFLKTDQTDQIPFVDSKFVCGDYARVLHDNAERSGWRCGYVIIAYDSHEEHACNVFNTPDKGIVYIDDAGVEEPTNNWDAEVSLTVGEDYQPVPLFTPEYERANWGKVKGFLSFW